MHAETVARLKKQLQEMETELRQALEDNADSTAPVQLDTSIGRLSRMDAIQSQQMALGLKGRQQQQLTRIEKALDAIEKGTYGQCRRCNGTIPLARLEAMPDAVLCVNCATKKG